MITYMIIHKTKAFIITKQFLICGDQLLLFPVFLTNIDGLGASLAAQQQRIYLPLQTWV